jgi:small subunit ribosomal protein S6
MSQNIDATQAYSALRGTQREYETTMILKPDTHKDGIRSLAGRLQAVLDKNGGRLQKIDNWGTRTLAYPIARNKKGIYLYIRYLGGSEMVKELERNLRIYPEVIRYLTVVVDEDVDPGARPSDIDEETLEAATETASDPMDNVAAMAEEATYHKASDDDDDDDDDDEDDD